MCRQWYNTSATLGDREFEDARPIKEQLARNAALAIGKVERTDNIDIDKLFHDRKSQLKVGVRGFRVSGF
jgi:hypothetical protein